MNRRQFLCGAASLAGAAYSKASDGASIRVEVDAGQTIANIPSDFLGLGYEISSVARTGLLSASNRNYVQLVRTLSPQGVIRIGGNTSDYASYSAAGSAVSEPKTTVINKHNLDDLGTFLHATGWKLIWGLNLGRGSEAAAVEEAQAVAASTQGNLLAFEIGNEPDLFGHAHRDKAYAYADYLSEYRRYKAAIRRVLPKAPFAGPDAATATAWVSDFARDEARDLKLLTHHYYRECANPNSTFDKLLQPDPKLQPMLEKLKAASSGSRLPYRICETNSFCGGGKPGVSDTFCAALWALDFQFLLAAGGAAGLNMETGVNQLGFISSYSPVADDEHGTYAAAPEYYGMLAFAQASQGSRLVAVRHDGAGANVAAYAVQGARNRLAITLINKDRERDAEVLVVPKQRASRSSLIRLTAPSLESKTGVTLGGAAVSERGEWIASQRETLVMKKGGLQVDVPATSAAIVFCSG